MDLEQRVAALEARLTSMDGEMQILRRRIQAMETAAGAVEPITDREDIQKILERRKQAKVDTATYIRTRGSTPPSGGEAQG